tara:strand:+ start:995 stop:1141 length:147 start_codon:yes stop_codon:yes gene_type:complete
MTVVYVKDHEEMVIVERLNALSPNKSYVWVMDEQIVDDVCSEVYIGDL